MKIKHLFLFFVLITLAFIGCYRNSGILSLKTKSINDRSKHKDQKTNILFNLEASPKEPEIKLVDISDSIINKYSRGSVYISNSSCSSCLKQLYLFLSEYMDYLHTDSLIIATDDTLLVAYYLRRDFEEIANDKLNITIEQINKKTAIQHNGVFMFTTKHTHKKLSVRYIPDKLNEIMNYGEIDDD